MAASSSLGTALFVSLASVEEVNSQQTARRICVKALNGRLLQRFLYLASCCFCIKYFILQVERLDIRGFKSYEKKLTLHFGKGVTCLVGPNGCGKTNLLDAIRWVLGEQRGRALRADKMENLIFNGSRSRKPLHFAEVSLTFDNTRRLLPADFSSIQFTRRLYRSGESEYAINGVPSRLKDITNLLLDTGTTFNAYSIIELKMVEDIINDTAHARRMLFEEAAGIARTKARKEETFKKLHATTADLCRVEDLLHEVSNNLKQAEKEAKQAQTYQRLKDAHIQAHVEMAAFALQEISEQRVHLNEKMATEKEQHAREMAARALQEARLQKMRHVQDKRQETLQARERILHTLTDRIKAVEHQQGIAQERSHALSERLTMLSQEKNRQQSLVREVVEKTKQVRRECAHLKESFTILEAAATSSQQAYEEQQKKHRVLREEVVAKRAQSEAVAEQFHTLTHALSVQRTERGSLHAQLTQLEEEERLAAEKIALLKAEALVVKQYQAEAVAAREPLSARHEALTNELKTRASSVITCQQAMAEAEQQLRLCEQKHALQQSLSPQLGWGAEGAQFLRKHSPWKQQKPLLLEVMHCEEPYRLVVERFLQPFLHHFVLDTADEAFAALAALQNKKVGCGGFFVRAWITGTHSAPAVPDKRLVPAVRLLSCDAIYEPLKNFLLQDVYFFEDASFSLDDLLMGPRCRSVLFADGTIASAAGIVGGTEEAHSRRGGMSEHTARLAKQVAMHKEAFNASRSQLEVAQVRRQDQAALLATVVQALKKNFDATQVINKRAWALGVRIKERWDHTAAYKQRRVPLLSRMEALEADIRTTHDALKKQKMLDAPSVDALREQDALLGQSEEALHAVLQRHQAAAARYQEEKYAYESRLQQLSFYEERARQFEEEGNQQVHNKAQWQKQVAEINKEQARREEEIISLHEKKKEAADVFQRAEHAYFNTNHRVKEEEKEKLNLEKKVDNLRFILAQLENGVEKNTIEKNNLLERMKVSFGQDERMLLRHLTNKTEATLARALLQIEQKINSVRSVNTAAIDNYKRLKERHDFILSEKNDLVEARRSLDETITKIDRHLHKQFMEAFYRIRERFQAIFREIFSPDDHCDLIMPDPNNPLASSVDIVAQPKGKKPLTIHQLSSGEKALIALALLFAAYMHRPSPFCVLDEVDAPLDDVNTEKFNRIIRTFSEQSQFVVITHNKLTMQAADVIYGVTMMEEGVSSVFPVTLEETAR